MDKKGKTEGKLDHLVMSVFKIISTTIWVILGAWLYFLYSKYYPGLTLTLGIIMLFIIALVVFVVISGIFAKEAFLAVTFGLYLLFRLPGKIILFIYRILSRLCSEKGSVLYFLGYLVFTVVTYHFPHIQLFRIQATLSLIALFIAVTLLIKLSYKPVKILKKYTLKFLDFLADLKSDEELSKEISIPMIPFSLFFLEILKKINLKKIGLTFSLYLFIIPFLTLVVIIVLIFSNLYYDVGNMYREYGLDNVSYSFCVYNSMSILLTNGSQINANVNMYYIIVFMQMVISFLMFTMVILMYTTLSGVHIDEFVKDVNAHLEKKIEQLKLFDVVPEVEVD